jgi:hypothetical protein
VAKRINEGRWPSLLQVGTAALGLATAAAGGYVAVWNSGKEKSDQIFSNKIDLFGHKFRQN